MASLNYNYYQNPSGFFFLCCAFVVPLGRQNLTKKGKKEEDSGGFGQMMQS